MHQLQQSFVNALQKGNVAAAHTAVISISSILTGRQLSEMTSASIYADLRELIAKVSVDKEASVVFYLADGFSRMCIWVYKGKCQMNLDKINTPDTVIETWNELHFTSDKISL